MAVAFFVECKSPLKEGQDRNDELIDRSTTIRLILIDN
jgi:hypothetical protein